ncbi:hypothetical protein Aduo_014747 [Ancylostoma duodenale]
MIGEQTVFTTKSVVFAKARAHDELAGPLPACSVLAKDEDRALYNVTLSGNLTDQASKTPPRSDSAISSAASNLEAVERSIKRMFSRRNYALRAAQTIAGIPPDSSCFSDSDCAGYPLSYCDGVCKCVQGTLNAGSTCISAAQQNVRTCPKGQTYVSEAGVCMTAVSPAGQCLYTSQCQAIEQGMTCENSVCRCPNGLVFSGSHCTPSCPISYVVDNRGVCIPGCQGNQIEVDGECLSHAVAGEPCRVHAQCTGGASCLKGRCVCPQDMISNGSVCVYGTTRSLFPR